jgi:hypothetical protein
MPTLPHLERHFTATQTVQDIVLGMSDGLTVPFALAAGLSGAVESTLLIVTAGLAEVAAGAIAMGLGGYYPPAPMTYGSTRDIPHCRTASEADEKRDLSGMV